MELTEDELGEKRGKVYDICFDIELCSHEKSEVDREVSCITLHIFLVRLEVLIFERNRFCDPSKVLHSYQEPIQHINIQIFG